MTKRLAYFYLSALSLIGASAGACAQEMLGLPKEIPASVQHVVDGDTIHVRVQEGVQVGGLGRGSNVKVRIVGIDAPESCQPWGKESTKALRQMLPLGSVVLLKPTGVDKYGRLLSDVYVGDATNGNVSNVAAAMVASGNAWNWIERNGSGRYADEERRARGSSSGLWQDGSALRPSEFRKTYGACK